MSHRRVCDQLGGSRRKLDFVAPALRALKNRLPFMRSDRPGLEDLVRLVKSFLRFVGVGAVNTVLSILLYEMLILFLPYRIAYLIPFPIGIAFLLYANSNFVFGRAVRLTSAALFTLFYLASYAAGFVLVIALVEWIGVPPAFAPIGVLLIMTPINFIGSRLALER